MGTLITTAIVSAIIALVVIWVKRGSRRRYYRNFLGTEKKPSVVFLELIKNFCDLLTIVTDNMIKALRP